MVFLCRTFSIESFHGLIHMQWLLFTHAWAHVANDDLWWILAFDSSVHLLWGPCSSSCYSCLGSVLSFFPVSFSSVFKSLEQRVNASLVHSIPPQPIPPHPMPSRDKSNLFVFVEFYLRGARQIASARVLRCLVGPQAMAC